MFNKELRLLHIKEVKSKESLKKAYFDMIKLYPPELYENEFIVITKAYEVLLKYLDDLENIKEKMDKEINFLDNINLMLLLIRKSILKNDMQNIDYSILSLCKIINLENFNIANEKCIDFIIELSKENYLEEALLISIHLDKLFKKLGLIDLSKAYKNLEEFIISKYK